MAALGIIDNDDLDKTWCTKHGASEGLVNILNYKKMRKIDNNLSYDIPWYDIQDRIAFWIGKKIVRLAGIIIIVLKK